MLKETTDGKPLVWVHIARLDSLRTRAKELQTLKQIQKEAPELRSDVVARKEVKYRIVEAERLLDETIAQAFDWKTGEQLLGIGRAGKGAERAAVSNYAV